MGKKIPSRDSFTRRQQDRFERRIELKIDNPEKKEKKKKEKEPEYSLFPEYPEDVIVQGFKQSKALRYAEYLDSFWNTIDPSRPYAAQKPEIIFEDIEGLDCAYFPRYMNDDFFHLSIRRIFFNVLKAGKIIQLEIGRREISMAKARELIISEGDTEDWVRLDFETVSIEGKTLLNFLKLTLQEKAFDLKRKCWFIPRNVVDPFLDGIKVLIKQGTLYGYQIIDNRLITEAFEDFFHDHAYTAQSAAPKTKIELLKKLEFICKEQAQVLVSIREDSDIQGLKLFYRKAALALHPDRNNGDGSKMAELNVVWEQLQQFK